MTNDVIERIKEIKKWKSIRNEDLANMTGISISTLSKILSGVREDYRFGTIKEIAKALDISLDYLAYGKAAHPTRTSTPQEMQLIIRFRRLSKDNRDCVLEYMNIFGNAADTSTEEIADTGATMFCRKCGEKIPKDSYFCPECGEEVVHI